MLDKDTIIQSKSQHFIKIIIKINLVLEQKFTLLLQ